MKKLMLSTLLLSAITTGATAMEYKLDPSHTNARFNIDHFQTSTNHGGFYGITGDVVFDPQNEKGSVEVTLQTNSLNTGNKEFDGHMQSVDFLNATKYPTISFTSTRWVFKDNKPVAIEGNLTMLGKTNPITLTTNKFNCYDNAMLKAQVCGGDFSTTIDRTQWGIDLFVDMGIPKEVLLKIQVEAVKK